MASNQSSSGGLVVGAPARFNLNFSDANYGIIISEGEVGIVQRVGPNYITIKMRKRGITCDVPTSVLDKIEQPHIQSHHIGFTAKCNQSFQTEHLSIEPGEVGIIVQGPDANLEVTLQLFYRRESTSEVLIPFEYLELGVKKGDLKFRYETKHAVRVRPVAGLKIPSDLQRRPMAPHILLLLEQFHENESAAALLPPICATLVADPATRADTCKMVLDNVANASDQIMSLLSTPDFTVHTLLDACPAFKNGDRRAGIYLRVYSDFRSNSACAGHKPYLYVGKTNSFDRRNGEHLAATKNKNNDDYDKFHYKVARQARKCRVVLLAVHDPLEGGDEWRGDGRRDLMEQIFFLLLGSYSSHVWSWTRGTHGIDLLGESTISSKVKPAEVFSSIQVAVSEQTGYAGGVSRPSFGAQDGLNFSSPLDKYAYGSPSMQVLWTRQEARDRWLFYRRPMIRKNTTITSMVFGDYTFTVTWPAKDKDWPAVGDEYWVIFEVMKEDHETIEKRQGEGDVFFADCPHPTPLVRLHQIGPWSNWSDANKVGLKVVWYSKAKRQWCSRYYQQLVMNEFRTRYLPGSLLRYCRGVLLYSYFMRARYSEYQPWAPSQVTSQQVSLELDAFTQTVMIRDVVTPLVTLAEVEWSEEVAAELMRQVGLDEVDSPWATFEDWSWVDASMERAQAREPQMTNRMKNRRKNKLKQRVQCDRCLLMVGPGGHGKQRESLENNLACEREENTRRCTNCIMHGLPCSWTNAERLIGPTWHDQYSDASGEFYEKVKKALVEWPADKIGTQLQVLGADPALVKLLLTYDDDQIEEH